MQDRQQAFRGRLLLAHMVVASICVKKHKHHTEQLHRIALCGIGREFITAAGRLSCIAHEVHRSFCLMLTNGILLSFEVCF